VPYPDDLRNPAPTDVSDALPQSCPSCGATRLVTTAKEPSSTSYWRCLLCGEIWTPARRQSQPAPAPRWGR
jgi:transposase-like protein